MSDKTREAIKARQDRKAGIQKPVERKKAEPKKEPDGADGKAALNARLRAIKQTFKPIGKAWADEDVRQNRARVPVKTGRLQRSFRVRNATQRKAVVVGHYTANFIDAGTREHDEVARGRAMKFQARGATMFAPRVHKRATAAHRFKRAAAEEALRRNPMAAELIKQWNSAA